HAVLIEIERMRILHRGIRHLVFGHVAGLRIELANQARAVAGEPDIAVAILRKTVRAGARGLERKLLELLGLRIEPADLVGELAGVPDGAIPPGPRIMRARARRR